MDVFDQTGAVDFNKVIDYIVKDFPGELRQIVSARDELAKRQGAIGAAEAAVADRKAAAETLAAAQNQAQQIVIEADAKKQLVDKQEADLKAKIAQFDADVKAFSDAADATDAALKQREISLRAGEESLAKNLADYDKNVAALEADRAALAVRVKAFQDKVAALSA